MPNNSTRTAPRCPLCGKQRVAEFRPFCSRGCRDRDLNRWFGEDYRVPAESSTEGDSEDDAET